MSRSLVALCAGTDKWESLLRAYEWAFAACVDRPVALLELGVLRGDSLLLWRDYFDAGTIAGIDLVPPKIDDPSGRIRLFQGSQDDYVLLDRVRAEVAPDGFDIIIDDASHVGEITRRSFWHLFRRHLKARGVYCIEDWGTAYWTWWPDGAKYVPTLDPASLAGGMPGQWCQRRFPSHLAGMAGVVKEMVDEVAMSDISRGGPGAPAARESSIHSLTVMPGIVLVVKR